LQLQLNVQQHFAFVAKWRRLNQLELNELNLFILLAQLAACTACA
jgi:hypothetical protein